MTTGLSTAVIILAAGSSSRMGKSENTAPKPFLDLNGFPVIYHSCQMFDKHPDVDHIVITLPKNKKSLYVDQIKKLPFRTRVSFIEGGSTRQGSSYNSLRFLKEQESAPDLVAIHDAARPFVSERMITEGLSMAKKYGAAQPAIDLTDTLVGHEKNKISDYYERDQLKGVQTPQCFSFSRIWQAHGEAAKKGLIATATDDAQLVFHLGYDVYIYQGSLNNFKITYQEDYERAKKYFLKLDLA
ncbi:2-C-methyl-D-erythritol 4-phosphate cytidylyltransferase [PVC group bacterium (ex Bugula neritina AB1)]|nr:2-C-methyl-D-erythritol 4-phosphate cytidylyltransferase [PVC group bacterium (ex Bugula neritina AB1)]